MARPPMYDDTYGYPSPYYDEPTEATPAPPPGASPPPVAPTAGPPAPGPAPGPGYIPYPAYGGPSRPNFGDIPGAPSFDWSPPPAFQGPGPFRAPTAEEAAATPGYQFRLGQGQQALEQSAAGRGILRTGGTLKDILGYGQNFASQEYGNVYDRAAGEFDRSYRNLADEYDRTWGNAFNVAQKQYEPKLADWQTRAEAARRAGELEFSREWEQYKYGADQDFEKWRTYTDIGTRAS